MTPNQICSFIANAMVCRSCGEVFNSIDHPHVDDDCPKSRADWEGANLEQVAATLHRHLKQGQADE